MPINRPAEIRYDIALQTFSDLTKWRLEVTPQMLIQKGRIGLFRMENKGFRSKIRACIKFPMNPWSEKKGWVEWMDL